MSARLLAYGGTSFSERRRIGQWPAVPQATLRDSYGLTAANWCYGMGVLERQPFLIFRQRQNVGNRGGYPFSLLLDPGEAIWKRFEWNGAAIIGALLNVNPELFFKTPEICSDEALQSVLENLETDRIEPELSDLSYLIVASTKSSEPLALRLAERPEPSAIARALSGLPVCFRASCGFLVGGGAAHGRALGANVVLDDRAAGAFESQVECGRTLLAAWERVQRIEDLNQLSCTPMWVWEENPAEILDAAILINDLQNAESATDELVEHVLQSPVLKEPIEQILIELLTRGDAPLGPQATSLLVSRALHSKKKIEDKMAARLDCSTLITELRKFESPPKKIPRTLPVPVELRVSLWRDYLERLPSDVRKNLEQALAQLGPDLDTDTRAELAKAALRALPGSDERLDEWARFQKNPDLWRLLEPALETESRRRLARRMKGGPEAYLLFGRDAGGEYARSILSEKDCDTLLASIQSLADEYPEQARHWLDALPKPPPEAVPAQPQNEPDQFADALTRVLFETARDEVDSAAEDLRARYKKANNQADVNAIVTARCESAGDDFARTFTGKYQALSRVMLYVPEDGQQALLEAFRRYHGPKFAAQATKDFRYAWSNRASKNAYSAALSRYLLKNADVRKQVAANVVEDPSDFEKKLKNLLAKKDGRN